MADSFVQVQPDSSGKQIDMGTAATNAGALIYRQRAELVGDSADMLFQILQTDLKILACLRAMLANQNVGNSIPNYEDEFLNID